MNIICICICVRQPTKPFNHCNSWWWLFLIGSFQPALKFGGSTHQANAARFWRAVSNASFMHGLKGILMYWILHSNTVLRTLVVDLVGWTYLSSHQSFPWIWAWPWGRGGSYSSILRSDKNSPHCKPINSSVASCLSLNQIHIQTTQCTTQPYQ